MFANATKLCTINGFTIRVDPSWLVIAALVTWSLSQQYFPNVLPDAHPNTLMTMALAAMVCFFTSLLTHELALGRSRQKHHVVFIRWRRRA
jgi:hypothetical protein